MIKYIPRDGREVDLEKPETYSGLPQDKWKVIESIYKQIGYCQFYIANSILAGYDFSSKQSKWIDEFVDEIAKNFHDNMHNRSLLWWQERLWKLIDETENMC